ncbi:hypothetical protein TNCT_403201 [Trichonephila clavata]|uniref:Uncharacterized protein n=1 Tax=Trichonephila clavata TaxID=2740835 RepID=A0A8X6LSN9_TRICU|nr:hypothetical protein TNCT_403201 [Trichonephila clavata]
MHPSHKKQVKLSMNILRTLTSNTGFHTTRSLRPLVGIRIAREQTEKSVLPPSRHVIRFQQSAHAMSLDYKACFKPVNGPPKTFQDNGSFIATRKRPGRSFEKSYLKQAHFRIKCPDLISRGNFRAIPARVHSLFNKLCFNLSTEDLFRITMQCFKSLTQWNVFQQCMSLL